jgi:hypothetical protein
VLPGPLTNWLALHRMPHNHAWRHQDSTERNILGQPIAAGSAADPPPVLFVSPASLAEFLRSSQEQDVKAFVQAMTAGADEEQERVIRKYNLTK